MAGAPPGENPAPGHSASVDRSVIYCSLEPLGGQPAPGDSWSVRGWVHWIGWLGAGALAGAGLAVGLAVGGSLAPAMLTVGGLWLGIWIHTRFVDPLAIRRE